MFEKANPLSAPSARAAIPAADERFAAVSERRSGGALRAVEWSELTARLNAARDLRLLLRTEGQAPIEAVAASFGDAAASYFAMLDDGELGISHGALGQSKALDATSEHYDTTRSGDPAGYASDALRGDARETE